MPEIIIAGGGASGLAAAVTAALAGAEVTVLEQNEIVGKKILSTGNGRCNLTNLHMDPACYRGDDPEFVRPVLKAFGPEEALGFFRRLGVLTTSRNGYVYPRCEQAAAVREAFALALRELGICVRTGVHVTEIRKTKKGFRVTGRDEGESFRGDFLILAAGSRASRISGSDGSGYTLAKQLGHSLSPVVPALVQLQARGSFFKKLAGIRVQAAVTLKIDGKSVASDTGEVQLTDYGISGIPVFQVSRYAAKALKEGKAVTAVLDFLPEMTREQLKSELAGRQKHFPGRQTGALLNTLFPAGLIPVLLSRADIRAELPGERLSANDRKRLTQICKEFTVDITGTNSFERAQICAGGVRTGEVSPQTMESRLVPGLYLTGELLDVDGICGGYNLHFAWATGVLAGAHAARRGKL